VADQLDDRYRQQRGVHLTGAVFNAEQRQAMRVAAENVPGVKAIEDHLAWIEPTSGFVIESRED
jgi:BON domain-containing protein